MPKSLQVEYHSASEALEALPEWLRSKSGAQNIPIKESKSWKHDEVIIGCLIRDRREKVNMSLRSAAKWMSVSPTYLSDMERGLRPWPTSRLEDITQVLEMAERTYKK